MTGEGSLTAYDEAKTAGLTRAAVAKVRDLGQALGIAQIAKAVQRQMSDSSDKMSDRDEGPPYYRTLFPRDAPPP